MLQGDPTEAAVLVGIDDARDRMVEIDTASGEVREVVAGDDVRADRIIWSPDESFAYLLSNERDRILVYDAASQRITQRIEADGPTDVIFHPSLDRAYVQASGIVELDTNDHRIVDSFDGPFAGHIALSSSGRWLFGVENHWVWVRDLWLSDSYDGALYHMDPLWDWEGVNEVGVASSSDALVIAADEALWTFDPQTRELHRFPYQGAGMGFTMIPDSDTAVLVSHRDLVQIDVTTGETNARRLDPPLYPGYRWNEYDQVSFSDDGSVVLLSQGNTLVARRTDTFATLWSADSSFSDSARVTPDGFVVLIYPRRWWRPPAAYLVDSGGVVTELDATRLRDAAWRRADRSFYLVGERGLDRVNAGTATVTEVAADARFVDIAIAGGKGFVISDGDRTLRSLDLMSGRLSESLRTLNWRPSPHALAFDPMGDRLQLLEPSEVTVFDVDTEQVLNAFAWEEVAGDIASAAILDADVAVVGWCCDDSYDAAAFVVDLASGEALSQHPLGRNGGVAQVVSEPSRAVALVGATESIHYRESRRPILARVSAEGLLDQWTGDEGTGVVALAPGAVEGQAFVGLTTVGGQELHLVDVPSGDTLAVHQLRGQLRALASDDSSVYAAVDAEPPLLIFDASSGELLGGLERDFRLTDVEVAAADALHGALVPVDLSSAEPPPGMVVAASGESYDITVWYDDERVELAVPGSSYDEEVAFGPGGILYAGAVRYQDGYYLSVLEPLSGAVLAEIRLAGAPGNILPTPDGELVFVETRFSSGMGLSVIDAATNTLIHELRPRGSWDDPVMTPDGVFVVAQSDDLVVLDTRTGEIASYPFAVPPRRVAATSGAAHYLGEDGRAYRIDLESGVVTVGDLLFPEGTATSRVELAAGDGVLVAYRGRSYEAELVTIEADTARRRGVLRTDGGEFTTVAASGAYGMTGNAASVGLWNLDSGHLLSRLVRPSGFDGGNQVWSIAVGCLENCPPTPAPLHRVRWDLLPSATPTSIPTATPTPTPRDNPPVDQTGVWIEVEANAGRPGEVIDVVVRRSSRYRESPEVTGYQVDLWFPEGVMPRQWRDGEPDCRVVGDRYDEDDIDRGYRVAHAFLPEGCRPGSSCRGVRALVTARWALEVCPCLVCRVRIAGDMPPGLYPMTVENLYLATDAPSERLQVVVGDIFVHGDRRTPTPTPDFVLEYYGPTPAPTPELWLRGRQVGNGADGSFEVEFYLSGGAAAPFRDELRAVVATEFPIRPVVTRSGSPDCQRNPELSNAGPFELVPPGCAETESCAAIAARVSVDTGLVGFDSGNPPVWFYRPDIWLFRCAFAVDEGGSDGIYRLHLGDGAFGERSVITEDVLLDVVVPRYTPTATATPTGTATHSPTPRPRDTPRPCVAEDGLSIVCVGDIEADRGDPVDLTVRYLSGGVDQAGLEFVVDLGEAFAEIEDGTAGTAWNETGHCRVNPEIDKNASAFARFGNRIKTLILAVDNLDPLRDDVSLITCTLDVALDVPAGEYEITLLEPGGSDPDGNALPLATRNGFLRVRGTILPSPTSTPLPDTATPTRTATTVLPSQTPNQEVRLAAEPGAASSPSGCQVAAPRAFDASTVAFMLLLAGSLIARCRKAESQVTPTPRAPRPTPLRLCGATRRTDADTSGSSSSPFSRSRGSRGR